MTATRRRRGPAVAGERRRDGAQRAGGQPAGLREEGDDRVAAAVDAAEAVGVAVVPGGVGVRTGGERGEVAAPEGVEAGADDATSAADAVGVVMCSADGRATVRAAGRARLSTVQSILAGEPVAHREHRQAGPRRDAALVVDVDGVGVDGRRRDNELGGDLALRRPAASRRRTSSSRSVRSAGSGGSAGGGRAGRVEHGADRVAVERQLGDSTRAAPPGRARGGAAAARRARAGRRPRRARTRRRRARRARTPAG